MFDSPKARHNINSKSSPRSVSEMKRAPIRAWLVTGPPGRLVGFILDFAKALRAHRRAKKAER